MMTSIQNSKPTLEGTSGPLRPAVLLALFSEGKSSTALWRAIGLARVLGAELHVIRVLPSNQRVNPLFPQRSLDDAVFSVARAIQSHELTQEWLSTKLGMPEIAERLTVVEGDFVEAVSQCAIEIGAQLVVIPSRGKGLGKRVTAIVHAAAVPVLVARKAAVDDTILAATDLQDGSFPVLQQAAELGRTLDATVVAIHNVEPVVSLAGFDTVWPSTGMPVQSVAPQKAALSRASDELAVQPQSVVTQGADAVEAILAEARARNADMVVVGTRQKNWFERLVTRSVAESVVDRARRSVLVTPMVPHIHLTPEG